MRIEENNKETQQEIYISEILNEYEYVDYFFITVKSVENTYFLKIQENENVFEKNINDRIVLKYNDIDIISIDEVIQNEKHIRIFFWDTFKKLIKSLSLLNQYNILHLQLNNNIVYCRDTLEVYICNFKESIHCKDVETLCKYNPRKYQWPLEYHIACYVNDILKEEDIKVIIDNFIKYHPILPYLGDTFMEKYKKEATNYIYSFIHIEKQTIIEIIKEFMNKWDSYGLCIHYLYYMKDLFFKEINSNTKMGCIMDICIKQISPDPNNRLNHDGIYEILMNHIELAV